MFVCTSSTASNTSWLARLLSSGCTATPRSRQPPSSAIARRSGRGGFGEAAPSTGGSHAQPWSSRGPPDAGWFHQEHGTTLTRSSSPYRCSVQQQPAEGKGVKSWPTVSTPRPGGTRSRHVLPSTTSGCSSESSLSALSPRPKTRIEARGTSVPLLHAPIPTPCCRGTLDYPAVRLMLEAPYS